MLLLPPLVPLILLSSCSAFCQSFVCFNDTIFFLGRLQYLWMADALMSECTDITTLGGCVGAAPPPSRAEIAGIHVPAAPCTLPTQVDNQLAVFNDTGYKEKQKLPSAPVLNEVTEQQVHLMPPGAWTRDYYIQSKEWSDGELMRAYAQQSEDTRQGQCAHCGVVTVDADEKHELCQKCTDEGFMAPEEQRMRKGMAELPTATLPARPFHFRHVRTAMPDYPEPSKMQELKLRHERTQQHERNARIQASLEQQQLLHQQQIRKYKLGLLDPVPTDVQGAAKRQRL
jgi:hypothetical protein